MTQTFGRVRSSTVTRYRRCIQRVRNDVLTALPASADEELRIFTLSLLLTTIFSDWNENQNHEDLADKDWADFVSFVQLSAELAGKNLTTQNRPIYESSLQSLMDDWLYNWNESGHSGPPSLRSRQRMRSAR